MENMACFFQSHINEKEPPLHSRKWGGELKLCHCRGNDPLSISVESLKTSPIDLQLIVIT